MSATTAKKLRDHTAEEQLALSYAELCRLRREHWAEHVASMTVPSAITAWAAQMAAKYGPLVKVHGHHLHDHLVDWPTALMIVRYGEATHVVKQVPVLDENDQPIVRKIRELAPNPENPNDPDDRVLVVREVTVMKPDPNGEEVQFWPTSFSADDVKRAGDWLDGSNPPPKTVVTYFAQLPTAVQAKALKTLAAKEG